MKRTGLLSLSMALLLLLTACGPKEPTPDPTPTPTPAVSVTPTPAPTPTVEPTPDLSGPLNPLTGLPIESEEAANARPVAIMLNNIKESLPQQGNSEADIIYECLEEGGITRVMGVYQSVKDVGMVGSIRSARSYYLQLALGHDAIFIHAGGSDEPLYEDAYGKIKEWGVTSLDGVRGPYMSTQVEGGLMWRDPARKKNIGTVHSVVTTGAMMEKLLPTFGIRLEHREGWSYAMAFADDGTPQNGVPANTIKAVYSSYKTGLFTYDPESKLYMVSQHQKPYVDGNSSEQVGVTNVVVLKAKLGYTGDKYDHVTIDLKSGGTGYFACGGKLIDLVWEKDYPSGQLRYTDLQGNPIVFGRGKTYVNIVPTDQTVEIG